MSRIKLLVALAVCAAASVSCGDVIREGRSPALLTVASLTANGSNTLLSDVLKHVTSPAPCSATSPCPVIVNDFGEATLTSSMKDTTVSPTSNNQITINRYHVEFTRADGRNTPGVDVPYAFDGAVTVTVPPNGSGSVNFELVRHVAKQESPLVQLETNADSITTIATITFSGTDSVGNAVSASGKMTVNFGNFADQ